MFSICFKDDLNIKEKMLEGEIIVNGFKETFLSPFGYWSKEKYELQWKEAIERILSGEKKSGLFTSFTNPNNANFFTCWPIYRIDEKIILQNHIIFLDQLESPFNEENMYLSISDYEIEIEEPCSEWEINENDMKAFLKN